METYKDKMDKLEEQRDNIEIEYDKKLQKIDGKISDLEKRVCEKCEGLGTYRFSHYVDKCDECHGTGFAQSKYDIIYDTWRDSND